MYVSECSVFIHVRPYIYNCRSQETDRLDDEGNTARNNSRERTAGNTHIRRTREGSGAYEVGGGRAGAGASAGGCSAGGVGGHGGVVGDVDGGGGCGEGSGQEGDGELHFCLWVVWLVE